MKHLRLIVVLATLIAFAATGLALAGSATKTEKGGEFYIVKGKDGKMSVVDKKPADPKTVVKGPFKTKKEADEAMKALPIPAPKPDLEEEGC